MNIEFSHFIQPSQTVKIELPNLARRYQLLPVRFHLKHKGTGESEEYVDPSLISCKVTTGNETIADWSQARFSVTPVIDLKERIVKLQEGRDMRIQLTNVSNTREETKDSLTVKIVVEYVKDYGGIIYQGTVTNEMNLNSILTEVRDKGFCTQLQINPDQSTRVQSLDLVPCFQTIEKENKDKEDKVDDEEDSWLCSLSISEQDEGRFVIDFIDADLMEYSDYLNFFKINLNTVKSETETADSKHIVHIVAYGYPC